MAAVSAVAQECHIPNVEYSLTSDSQFYVIFSNFSLAVQREVARIRIRSRGMRHPYSVLLTGNTRSKIEHYISRIRCTVEASDLDLDRKQRLFEKLDQLVAELGNQRLSFAKTMALLAAVLAALGSSVTIAADGQNAIAHIMQLIGHDKESEDAAAQRLSPPPKALPAPPAAKPHTVKEKPLRRISNADIIDDDIPF